MPRETKLLFLFMLGRHARERTMRTDQLRYEPDRRLPYGYWTCDTCGASFYGNGYPLHALGCAISGEGYASCLYHFGPVEVAQIKLVGHSIGILTFRLYCVWRSEGNERPDLGELDVEAMLRNEDGER